MKVLALIGCFVFALLPGAALSQLGSSSQDGAWTQKSFDFGASDLNFTALTPPDVKVETALYLARRPDGFGALRIVGKVGGFAPPLKDMTIVAYDLRSSAPPLRVCLHEATRAGYEPRWSKPAPNVWEATVVAVQEKDGKISGGVVSRCVTRGFKMLAFHLLFDVATSGEGAADKAAEAASRAMDRFFDTLRYELAPQGGEAAGMQSITIKHLDVSVDAAISDQWKIAFNDTSDAKTELMAVRAHDGQILEFVWFGVSTQLKRPDLDNMGRGVILEVLKRQSAQFGEPVLLASEKRGAADGGEQQVFTYSVPIKGSKDPGKAFARAAWRGDRLFFVVGFQPPTASENESDLFFTRLPMLTVYDAFCAAIDAFPRRAH